MQNCYLNVNFASATIRTQKNKQLHSLRSPPPRQTSIIKLINLVSEKHIKQPAYCRSLCSDRYTKISLKADYVHGRKGGYWKVKITKKRSEQDLKLLSSYRNKHIP